MVYIVEPVYHVDPGGSAVELQNCELSFAYDKCSDRQAMTLVMSPLSCDVYQTILSIILATPMYI